jgi:hypothetical protein
MTEFILEPFNLPFLVAILILITLLVIELISMAMGAGLSGILDNQFDADMDMDGDMPANQSFFSFYLSWMRVKQVPLLILLVLYLGIFAICGYLLQKMFVVWFGFPLPHWVSVPSAFLIGYPFYLFFGNLLGEHLFKDESSAVYESSFVGKLAEITVGTAKQGNPAEAKLIDEFGQLHYLMVEPEKENVQFKTGEKVKLTQKGEINFKAIKTE